MKTATFAQNLLSMQTELLHFAYKLTADRENWRKIQFRSS